MAALQESSGPRGGVLRSGGLRGYDEVVNEAEESGRAASRGDDELHEPKSFAELFEQHHERFLRVARHYRRKGPAAGDPNAETMDYVQDASAEYLKKPRDVKSETHFLQLFAGFIKNAWRGRRRDHRAQKRGGGQQPADLPQTGAAPAADLTGPRTAAGRSEAEDIVLQQLAQLRPDDRQVITMRLWDELDFAEIAERLELPSAEAARKRYSRAIEKLEGTLPDV